MFEKITFKNNLRLLTIPIESVDSVTVVVFVKAGGRYEAVEKSGLSHFVEHTIFKGTVKRPSAKEIAMEIEQVGGVHNAATSHEFTYYYIKVPSEKSELAFDILSDVIFNSQFKESDLQVERKVILEEINYSNDSPIDKVGDYLMNLLWPNHPLGTDLLGTKKQFLGLTREDVQEYVKTYYHPNNILIVVAGNLKRDLGRRLTERFLLRYPKKDIPSFLQVREEQHAPQLALHYKQTDQTHFLLGVRSLPINHPDKYILEVLTAVLGKGMSSRLFEILREKNGLCYYISAGSDFLTDTGCFYVHAGVDNARFLQAISLIMKELKKLKTARVPKKELRKAKEYLKGKLKLSMETSEAQASFYGLQELMLEKILTVEEVCSKIEAVTNDDIMRVAHDLFINKRLNLAAISPEKEEGKVKNLLSF